MQCFIRALRAHRKGVVALWVAVSAPVLMASVGLGIQAAQMAVTRSELQVAADTAAVAGALAYGASANDETAANAAANVAELNGVAGAATRSWNAGTRTLSDGSITVTLGAGVASTANTSVAVTVTRSIQGAFAMLVGGSPTQIIGATATADAMPGATGGQPCMLALDTDSDAINMTGSTLVTGRNCAMRSNGGVRMTGSGDINVQAIYTGGTISTTGSVSITGAQNENAGTITDPFLSYAPLQTALASLSPGSGSSVSKTGVTTVTLNPGTYKSMSFTGSGTVTLNPGLYVVNGDITATGSTIISGNGVTIISSGKMSLTGSSSVQLAAPDASALAGGVPGVLYASTSTRDSTVTGSTGMPVTGLIYTPNAHLTFTGSSAVNGCTELVAGTITMTGSSAVESNCVSYGLPGYGSVAGTAGAKLVR